MLATTHNEYSMRPKQAMRIMREGGLEKMCQAFGLSVFWLQWNGNIHHCNQKFADLVGLTQAELENKQIFQLSVQMTFFKLRDIYSTLQTDSYFVWNDEFLLKESTVKLRIHSCMVNSPEGELICCIVQDASNFGKIIKLNPTQQAKSNPNSFPYFANSAIENTNALVFWLDSNFSIKYLNERAKLVLNYDFENGGEIDSFLKIDLAFADQNWENIQLGLAEKRRLELTGTLINKLGNKIPVEYYLFRIEPDNTNNICLIARDISEKIKQEDNLKNALRKVEDLTQKLKTENIYLKEEINSYNKFDNIISESKAYQKTLRNVAQVAPTDSTVLILGETGTGKELLAKAIHSLSPRNEKPFLKVNCAALPHEMMESELFGHEKGAFTGAFERRIGRFEAANGGTLFLDEIGEMPLELQIKLLRVLQEQEFERVGSNHTITVNVRIIAATNRDLARMVAEGKFRQDLYYRLNVFPINNIPLRERKDDILPLVRHFIKKYNRQMGKNVKEYVESDMALLESYEFPGNIRELENIIERAIILSNDDKLNMSDWQVSLKSKPQCASFEDLQKNCILAALEKAKWKVDGKGGAAELLGMTNKMVYAKLMQFGLSAA